MSHPGHLPASGSKARVSVKTEEPDSGEESPAPAATTKSKTSGKGKASSKKAADSTKAVLPDLKDEHVLNNILGLGVDPSRFQKSNSKLNARGVPKKIKLQYDSIVAMLEDWVDFNHMKIGDDAPASELNLLDFVIRLCFPENAITQLMHVKQSGQDPNPVQHFVNKLKKSKVQIDLQDQAAVDKSIKRHHDTEHRLCKYVQNVWLQHPFVVACDNQSRQKILETLQALYNDKLRLRLELIDGIGDSTLRNLGKTADETSAALSLHPPLKALKTVFNITDKSITQAGYYKLVGNRDQAQISQITAPGSLTMPQIDAASSSKKRKRSKDTVPGPSKRGKGSVKSERNDEDQSVLTGKKVPVDGTKAEDGSSIKQESTPNDYRQSASSQLASDIADPSNEGEGFRQTVEVETRSSVNREDGRHRSTPGVMIDDMHTPSSLHQNDSIEKVAGGLAQNARQTALRQSTEGESMGAQKIGVEQRAALRQIAKGESRAVQNHGGEEGVRLRQSDEVQGSQVPKVVGEQQEALRQSTEGESMGAQKIGVEQRAALRQIAKGESRAVQNDGGEEGVLLRQSDEVQGSQVPKVVGEQQEALRQSEEVQGSQVPKVVGEQQEALRQSDEVQGSQVPKVVGEQQEALRQSGTAGVTGGGSVKSQKPQELRQSDQGGIPASNHQVEEQGAIGPTAKPDAETDDKQGDGTRAETPSTSPISAPAPNVARNKSINWNLDIESFLNKRASLAEIGRANEILSSIYQAQLRELNDDNLLTGVAIAVHVGRYEVAAQGLSYCYSIHAAIMDSKWKHGNFPVTREAVEDQGGNIQTWLHSMWTPSQKEVPRTDPKPPQSS